MNAYDKALQQAKGGNTIIIREVTGENTDGGDIQSIYDALESHCLDPRFERDGFSSLWSGATSLGAEFARFEGATQFKGDFMSSPGMFHVITVDPIVIEKLSSLIAKNMTQRDYKLISSKLFEGYRYIEIDGFTKLASPAVIDAIKDDFGFDHPKEWRDIYEGAVIGDLRIKQDEAEPA